MTPEYFGTKFYAFDLPSWPKSLKIYFGNGFLLSQKGASLQKCT